MTLITFLSFIIYHLSSFLSSVYCCGLYVYMSSAWEGNKELCIIIIIIIVIIVILDKCLRLSHSSILFSSFPIPSLLLCSLCNRRIWSHCFTCEDAIVSTAKGHLPGNRYTACRCTVHVENDDCMIVCVQSWSRTESCVHVEIVSFVYTQVPDGFVTKSLSDSRIMRRTVGRSTSRAVSGWTVDTATDSLKELCCLSNHQHHPYNLCLMCQMMNQKLSRVSITTFQLTKMR